MLVPSVEIVSYNSFCIAQKPTSGKGSDGTFIQDKDGRLWIVMIKTRTQAMHPSRTSYDCHRDQNSGTWRRCRDADWDISVLSRWRVSSPHRKISHCMASGSLLRSTVGIEGSDYLLQWLIWFLPPYEAHPGPTTLQGWNDCYLNLWVKELRCQQLLAGQLCT